MRNEQIAINGQMDQTKREIEIIKNKIQQFEMSTVAGRHRVKYFIFLFLYFSRDNRSESNIKKKYFKS